MHRKAAKQIDKLTQWTGEKFLKESKTEHSDEFKEFEQEIELRRIGVERLHATSIPYHSSISKRKPSADPYSHDGSSSKEKHLPGESLGLVMISHGEDIMKSGLGDRDYGVALEKYGKARCQIAMVQEEYANTMGQGYISGIEQALAIVKDYQTIRKKLDSKRLALDAAIRKKAGAKKETTALDDDIRNCTARYEEAEEECHNRMMIVQEGEAQQMSDLSDLLSAELEYLGKYMEILGNLKAEWGGGRTPTSANRPRSKSTSAVTKSVSSRAIPSRLIPNRASTPTKPSRVSSEDDIPSSSANRSRSHSNASASSSGKPKKSLVPSFGSFGKKSGSKFGLGSGGKEKYGAIDGDEESLRDHDAAREDDDSDDDDYGRREEERTPVSLAKTGRARSQSSLSTMTSALRVDDHRQAAPAMRRTNTTPDSPTPKRYVKALFEFNGTAHDELTFEVGAIIEVKSEVSADWWIGEDEHGDSGLFPSGYTESYEEPGARQQVPPPLPTTNRRPVPAPGVTTPRKMPPPARGGSARKQTAGDTTTDDDDDSDIPSTTAAKKFTSVPMSQSSSSSSTGSGIAGKKKPPPPPARKLTSSSGAAYASPAKNAGFEPPTGVQRMLAPPAGGVSMKKTGSAGGVSSPFEVSEDEGAAKGVADCRDCGCSDFTQNVFKPAGTCSTCFHSH